MIKLTGRDGETILLSASSITVVSTAGASQAWHGIRSNVRADGIWYEVRETTTQVMELIEREEAKS